MPLVKWFWFSVALIQHLWFSVPFFSGPLVRCDFDGGKSPIKTVLEVGQVICGYGFQVMVI